MHNYYHEVVRTAYMRHAASIRPSCRTAPHPCRVQVARLFAAHRARHKKPRTMKRSAAVALEGRQAAPEDLPELPKGSQVMYTQIDGTRVLATIVKVHYDDLPPYYTISINGQERSTVRTKLSAVEATAALEAHSWRASVKEEERADTRKVRLAPSVLHNHTHAADADAEPRKKGCGPGCAHRSPRRSFPVRRERSVKLLLVWHKRIQKSTKRLPRSPSSSRSPSGQRRSRTRSTR